MCAIVVNHDNNTFRTGPCAIVGGRLCARRDVKSLTVDIAVIIERVEFARDRRTAGIADTGSAFDPDFHRASKEEVARPINWQFPQIVAAIPPDFPLAWPSTALRLEWTDEDGDKACQHPP